jgi:hypothetical protein
LAGVISQPTFWREQQVLKLSGGNSRVKKKLPAKSHFATFLLAGARDFKNKKPETFKNSSNSVTTPRQTKKIFPSQIFELSHRQTTATSNTRPHSNSLHYLQLSA